jgi:hypothetical protein
MKRNDPCSCGSGNKFKSCCLPLFDSTADNTPTSCVLCNQPADVVGVFEPSESGRKRLNLPAGRQRFVLYGLCNPCFEIPDKTYRIEEIIFRQCAMSATRGGKTT